MRGNFGLKLQKARNCLANMLDFIVMQMSKVNREKGYINKNNKIQAKTNTTEIALLTFTLAAPQLFNFCLEF